MFQHWLQQTWPHCADAGSLNASWQMGQIAAAAAAAPGAGEKTGAAAGDGKGGGGCCCCCCCCRAAISSLARRVSMLCCWITASNESIGLAPSAVRATTEAAAAVGLPGLGRLLLMGRNGVTGVAVLVRPIASGVVTRGRWGVTAASSATCSNSSRLAARGASAGRAGGGSAGELTAGSRLDGDEARL